MYKIEISNTGGSVFKVKSGENSFIIDPNIKGSGPLDSFLAGLGGCVGYYLRLFCSKNGIKADEFGVLVEGELLKEKPVRFSKIDITIDLKSAKLDEETRKKMLEFVRNCPAHNTLKSGPEVNINL